MRLESHCAARVMRVVTRGDVVLLDYPYASRAVDLREQAYVG